jgi:hypothetical protein
MELPEFKHDDPKPFWAISAFAGSSLFLILNLAGIGPIERNAVGYILSSGLGFFIGWGFYQFIKEVEKQEKSRKRENQILAHHQKAFE